MSRSCLPLYPGPINQRPRRQSFALPPVSSPSPQAAGSNSACSSAIVSPAMSSHRVHRRPMSWSSDFVFPHKAHCCMFVTSPARLLGQAQPRDWAELAVILGTFPRNRWAIQESCAGKRAVIRGHEGCAIIAAEGQTEASKRKEYEGAAFRRW